MKLFKDRILNIAVLVSASWHILCLFAISPALMSGKIAGNHAPISFLGSILDKISIVPDRQFELESVSTIQRPEASRQVPSKGFLLTPPEFLEKSEFIQPDKERMAFSKDRDIIFTTYYDKKTRSGIDFKAKLVGGEAKDRLILYKPSPSRLSISPSSFRSDYSVDLRFKISRYGFVGRPECIVSSGSPEVDQVARRYIRRWQFVPLDPETRVMQEGMVRLSFKAP